LCAASGLQFSIAPTKFLKRYPMYPISPLSTSASAPSSDWQLEVSVASNVKTARQAQGPGIPLSTIGKKMTMPMHRCQREEMECDFAVSFSHLSIEIPERNIFSSIESSLLLNSHDNSGVGKIKSEKRTRARNAPYDRPNLLDRPAKISLRRQSV